MNNTDLWGNLIVRDANYFVFHDESIPNKRWLLTGLLFVRDADVDYVLEILMYWRKHEDYWGEVHFSELPRSFKGKWSGKARVARAWLKAYEDELHNEAFFIALAVDRHSPAYEYNRFSKDYHAYNRFTAMALKAGVSWFLKPYKYENVHINFISDEKDRQTALDEEIADNFESYIPYRAMFDSFLSKAEGKDYPSITVDVKLENSESNDLLQLCDLILGATQAALIGKSKRETKRELGEFIIRWHKDAQKPPWEQEYELHRKFSIWAFPDKEGRPYTDIHFVLEDENQLVLFK